MKNKILLLALLLAGCKGPMGSQGNKGDAGMPGMPGGHFDYISGPITNDDFIVTDSRLSTSEQTTVYLSDGTNYTALNSFLPTLGVNAYYLASTTANKVEIFNAKKAGGLSYVIDVYLP